MTRTSIGKRCLVSTGIIVFAVGATAAGAAPSQATKDRCTRYAKRAVEQYRLMTSHPECAVKNDPLTWQDSYDNHYNGCLIFPESMAKLGEQSRDNHLQACGALSDSAPAAGAASAKPGAGGTAAPTGAGATSAAKAAPAGGGSAPAAPPAAAAQTSSAVDCQTQRPSALPETQNKVGFGALVSNGTLSFHSIPHQGELQSYGVIRPAYIVRQLGCTGRADDRYGPWVTLVGEKGAEVFLVGADDAVFAAPLSAEAAQQLLTR